MGNKILIWLCIIVLAILFLAPNAWAIIENLTNTEPLFGQMP